MVLGLLLSGCQTAQEGFGVNFEKLPVGMNKGNLRSHSTWTFVQSVSSPWFNCSYKYYPKHEAEIISSEDNTIHLIFESVKNPGACRSNNGTFHSAHKTRSLAEKKLKNDIKTELETTREKKSSDLTFTIKDKKEQCTAIGFTPATDKFADCVLRLVELDLKTQLNNSAVASANQTNSEIADELRNQRRSDALLDLGQQLLNPSSPASTMSTRTCSVRGTGTMKRVTCY